MLPNPLCTISLYLTASWHHDDDDEGFEDDDNEVDDAHDDEDVADYDGRDDHKGDELRM